MSINSEIILNFLAVLNFYRDHSGAEVDFVFSIGNKVKLYECKWSEVPDVPKGFKVLEDSLGPERILSKAIVTPVRSNRMMAGKISIENPVDLIL